MSPQFECFSRVRIGKQFNVEPKHGGGVKVAVLPQDGIEAKLIVGLPLVLITEDLIGLIHLFKHLLSLRVLRFIRVINLCLRKVDEVAVKTATRRSRKTEPSVQVKTGQVRSRHVMSGQVWSHQVSSDQLRSADAK